MVDSKTMWDFFTVRGTGHTVRGTGHTVRGTGHTVRGTGHTDRGMGGMPIDGRSPSVGLPLSRVQQERFKAALLSARAGALLVSAQRQAVREVLQMAGALRRRPEQCVVAFKSFMHEAANEIAMPLGRDRSALLERFVTLFIEEMYAADMEIATEDVNCRGKTPGSAIPTENRELPGVRL